MSASIEQAEIDQPTPRIRRGNISSLTVFEITDYELDTLERGGPVSTYQTFGIFLLSTGLSFAVSLLTTNIESDRLFLLFTVVTFVGIVFGIMSIAVWYRERSPIREVCDRIRSRVPPDHEPLSSRDLG